MIKSRTDAPARWKRRTLLALLALGALGLGSAPASASPGESNSKILEGKQETRGDVGWVTAILGTGSGSRFDRQFCGGSLVSRRYVLTAAHCVVDENGQVRRASRTRALMGTKNLNSGGKLIGVSQILVFPDYGRFSEEYGDMALLRLKANAPYKPARLVGEGVHYAGTNGYVAGWGNRAPIESGENDFPTRLHSAFLPIVADSFCAQHDETYDGDVMLCAGHQDGSPDTCEGDSGGPLARKVNGRWRIVGVTSYANPGCGSVDTYGVYAWVGSPILRGWLRQYVG